MVSAGPAHAEQAPGLGVIKETFVDHSRPTAANGTCKKIASRTLPTTIYYPATTASPAPEPNAPPDTTNAPYPLIVFAHGFSATVDTYSNLLQHLALAGYVVAAPTFPLSSGDSPCGAIAGDSVNQPEDMSFVITELLNRAKADDGPLAGLIDPHSIGAAGHSNGAVTMYGLVGNTRLHDKRVDAVAVLAGTAQKYPQGRYDFKLLPPILLVHGSEDELVPYDAAVEGFNRAAGPKGLLTMVGGDHGSSASPPVFGALTDFFDAYLRGDGAAKGRLPSDQIAGVSTMNFVAEKGATTTIPTQPKVTRHLKATVTPHKNLKDGQIVTVTWSGYTPGKAVSVLECNPSDRHLTDSTGCDYTKAALLHDNPTGEGTLQLQIIAGQVGNGICDAEHKGCFILIDNESSSDPNDAVFVTLTFAKVAP